LYLILFINRIMIVLMPSHLDTIVAAFLLVAELRVLPATARRRHDTGRGQPEVQRLEAWFGRR